MESRGRGRRGRPQGAGQTPPVFDQQAFTEAVGVAASTIAQASVAGSQRSFRPLILSLSTSIYPLGVTLTHRSHITP